MRRDGFLLGLFGSLDLGGGLRRALLGVDAAAGKGGGGKRAAGSQGAGAGSAGYKVLGIHDGPFSVARELVSSIVSRKVIHVKLLLWFAGMRLAGDASGEELGLCGDRFLWIAAPYGIAGRKAALPGVNRADVGLLRRCFLRERPYAFRTGQPLRRQ